MRHSLFYWIVGGFVTGILARSFINLDTGFGLFILLMSFVLGAYFIFTHTAYNSETVKIYSIQFIMCIIIFAASIGMLRYQWFTHYLGDESLQNFIGKNIEAEGVVVGEPAEKENGMRLTIAIDTVATQAGTTTIRETKITALDGPYSRIEYGDRVRITGKLRVPENFKTEGEREFNYVAYLAKDKIFYQISFPKIYIVSKHNGNAVKEILLMIKKKYIENLDAILPYPESRLAAGLTVAGKGVLPKSVQEDFQHSGTMQVVVLSGYNVTIIAEAASALLSSAPKLIAGSISITGIILFTIMAGGSATIVRGSIMAILIVLATLMRRRSHPGRALTLAGFFMLMVNPMLLAFDPSFQLSFLATFALIVVSPIFKKYFSFVTERWNLREVVAATIATQLFVTPFIFYQTGQLSLVALPANLLLFLVIPITMLFSFLAGMAAFLTVTFALPFSWLAFLLLRYELVVVNIFANLPFANIAQPYVPAWLVLAVYGCYGVLILRHGRDEISMKKL